MFNQIPADWTSASIGTLGELYNGLSGKSADDFGVGKYYVTYMQVFRGGSINESDSGLVTVEETEIQNTIGFGDVLFTTSSETPDDIGTANVFLNHSFKPFLNSFCFGLRIREHSLLHPHYAKFLFRGNNYRRKVNRISQGSTRYNLSKKYFKKIKVILPPPIDN